jgi:hypothetical protein
MEYVESHLLEKGHTFQLKEMLQIHISKEVNLCLIKVKTTRSNSMNLIVAGRNFYVSATYSVQYGWQVTKACCRFGDRGCTGVFSRWIKKPSLGGGASAKALQTSDPNRRRFSAAVMA